MKDFSELSEFLTNDENKTAFGAYVKALGYETPDEIQGLKAKNLELIGKHKKIRDEYENAKKVLDNIDLDEYQSLREQYANTKGKGDTVEASRLQRELKKIQDEYKSTTDKYTALESEYNDTLTKSEISKAIESAGFDARHNEILKSAFRGKAKIEVEDGKRSVLIDNGDGLGLPVIDFFKNFAASETGKVYLRQPDNRGAGSQSFKGAQGKQEMARAQFDKLPSAEKMTAIKSGVKIV